MNELRRWYNMMLQVGSVTSQSDAAKRFGWTQSTLNSYMTGHRKPSRKRAVQIEQVTGGLVPRHCWY